MRGHGPAALADEAPREVQRDVIWARRHGAPRRRAGRVELEGEAREPRKVAREEREGAQREPAGLHAVVRGLEEDELREVRPCRAVPGDRLVREAGGHADEADGELLQVLEAEQGVDAELLCLVLLV